jgi:hypothetical protein
MTEQVDHRQAIKEFFERNKELMGDITTVMTTEGEVIDLNDMTDEQAQRAAEALFVVGTPTRLGALVKR